LQKIIDQGLACVEDEDLTTEDEDLTTQDEEKQEEISNQRQFTTTISSSSKSSVAESIINLNSGQREEKVIYESKNEKINKNLLWGFAIFILGLFYLLLKNR